MRKRNKKVRGVKVLHGGGGTPPSGTVAYRGTVPEQVSLLKGLWSRDEEIPELVPPQRDGSSWMSPHWETKINERLCGYLAASWGKPTTLGKRENSYI